MYQEARKHEKKLRELMVDHKRRAERRRDYYEKIVSKPANCPVKHLDLNLNVSCEEAQFLCGVFLLQTSACSIKCFSSHCRMSYIERFKNKLNDHF
jgi:hypothetical protein